jgi:hypothetical protein
MATNSGPPPALAALWRHGDYGVLEDGVIVRRIFVVPVAPEGLDVGRAVTMAIYAGRVRV